MAWYPWVVLAMALFIGEIFTAGFFLLSFGAGCLVSAICSAFGLGLNNQIVGFIAGTLITFFGIRPILLKWAHSPSQEVKTNVDALIHQTGMVTETIDALTGRGRVAVRGDDWKALSADGRSIDRGTHVEVVKVEGIKLYVRPVEHPN